MKHADKSQKTSLSLVNYYLQIYTRNEIEYFLRLKRNYIIVHHQTSSKLT